jgi:hypothetical protein
MSLTTNDMSAADIAAVCGNNRGGDGFGWGGDGIWFLILFLALIGNGGWGNNGGFDGRGGLTVPSSFGNILLPNN